MREKFFKNVEFETQRGAGDEFTFFSTSAGKKYKYLIKKQRKGTLYAGNFKHYLIFRSIIYVQYFR